MFSSLLFLAQIKLRSSDGKILKTGVKAAKLSATICEHLKEIDADQYSAIIVPVPEVHSSHLAKVLSWCHWHQNDQDESVPGQVSAEWDAAFMAANPNMIIDVLKASNHLAIPGLIEVAHRAMATMREEHSAPIQQHGEHVVNIEV